VLPEEVRKAEKLTSQQIEYRVLALPGQPEWVTLSGGNPALHGLNFVVERLHSDGFKVTVETQGSIWKPWLGHLDALTVSPKPPSSGMVNPFLDGFIDTARDTQLIHSDRVGLSMKVPIFNQEDYDWARRLHDAFPDVPFYLSVVTRMGGLHGTFDGGKIDTVEDVLSRYRWLVEKVAGDPVFGDVAVFPQLHVLLWSHDRGH
jgi:7-carboxy-7-deazaguanine synthase